MDAIPVWVPTPLTLQRERDLGCVVETTCHIARTLRPVQLIVLQRTTYPGTVAEVMKPIQEQGGAGSGRDFFMAYSPEREDLGNIDFATASIPKVVGGAGPEALKLAMALYGEVVQHTVLVSTIVTAEAVKLTENIFRAVTITLVNELKVIFAAMGIDVWEVIAAAKTKPLGYMPHPGPGSAAIATPSARST